LERAAMNSSLLLTARLLVTDLVQAFGLAEVLHVDADGRVRVNFFGENRDRVRQWAAARNAEVSEQTAPD
jgi:hypothetical protein